MRDPEDDESARLVLEQWIKERPEAGIVVAAIERLPDDTLDVAVKLSRLSGYHLIGLVQALLQQAMDIAIETTPNAALDPEFQRMRQAKALLDADEPPMTLQ